MRWLDLLDVEFSSSTPAGPIVLALCSDGVWDNWKFEDVSQFTLHPGRVNFALGHETAQACCVDLMQANLERARVNFGNSADNMSVVLAYLIPHRERLHEAQEREKSGAQADGTGLDTHLGTGAVGTGTGTST